MSKAKILENKNTKILKSLNYNYIFSKETGFFARWGKNMNIDPLFSPFGPEIADIEIGTICHGVGKPCNFCYKSNTPKGEYMDFKTFKKVVDKFPKTLTQIAFGLGDIDSNPDLWKICKYCRKKGIIPNITINGARLTEKIIKNLVKYMGAVAVSHYEDSSCFDTIKKLSDKGMKQINIHKLLARETLESCYDLVEKTKTDERLKGLNAIVFLSLKKKGQRNNLNTVNLKEFSKLIKKVMKEGINYGFDSCGSAKFLKVIENEKSKKQLEQFVEPCESSLFSIYINVKGEIFPCSFCEGEKDWKEGINLLKEKNILEIWNTPQIQKFRSNLLENCRNCPIYKI